mmetsp:Transcript_28375/g.28673  ORF Transcript_28375/g.28673 Transcript_28375/m.28673 type:complete len:275 (+) Transcript_28375:187-1011(+)
MPISKYTIEGNEKQSLQVVLPPGGKLYSFSPLVCWSSANIKIEQTPYFFIRIFQFPNNVQEIVNEGQMSGFVGLAQYEGGNIIIFNLDNTSSVKKISFFMENFICASQEILITPIQLTGTNPFYRIFCRAFSASTSSSGQVFIQSGSQIMSKNLGPDDRININLSCLVAYEETCVIHMPTNRYMNHIFDSTSHLMISVKGPGTVYFSAHNIRRTQQYLQGRLLNRGGTSPPNFVHIFTSLILFYIFTVVLTRLMVEFSIDPFVIEQFNQANAQE